MQITTAERTKQIQEILSQRLPLRAKIATTESNLRSLAHSLENLAANRDRAFDPQIHNVTETTARNYPDPFDNPEEFADYIKSRIESLSQSNQNQRDKLFDILTYIQRRLWDIYKSQNLNLGQFPNIKQVILNEIDCLFEELDEMK